MSNCSRCDGPVRETVLKAFESFPAAEAALADAPNVCEPCLLEAAKRGLDGTVFSDSLKALESAFSAAMITEIAIVSGEHDE